MTTPIRNDALADLAVLEGEWDVRLSNAEFLDGDAVMTGAMTAAWLDGAALLVLRQAMDDDGPPASVSVVGRNEAGSEFTVLYADERGVSRVYGMSFDSGAWTQYRADPGFHQRFDATVGPDRIEGTWSKSHDGGVTWEHDFDLEFRRRS